MTYHSRTNAENNGLQFNNLTVNHSSVSENKNDATTKKQYGGENDTCKGGKRE